MSNNKKLNVINTKCYEAHNKYNVSCQRKKCKNWIQFEEGYNCLNITIKNNGQLTLQEIGNIYNLTRMRICQIEKKICEKINLSITEDEKIN